MTLCSGSLRFGYCYTETRNNYISSRNYYNKNIDYYQCLETNGYPFADVVIMHFDEDKIRKDILQPIIKVKGRLGHLTPILAVIENGSMQDIFSVLKIGVYDYIETIDDLEKYQKKIQDIILWDWYLKKYKGG